MSDIYKDNAAKESLDLSRPIQWTEGERCHVGEVATARY